MRIVLLAVFATLHLPVGAHQVRVFTAQGRQLESMSDPAYDTCGRQTAFIAHPSHLIVAMYSRCSGKTLANYSHQALVVTYKR